MDLQRSLECSGSEHDLANTLADVVFMLANEGISPAVYIELAAIILARTAHDAIAHHNTTAPAPVNLARAENALLRFAIAHAGEEIAARRGRAPSA